MTPKLLITLFLAFFLLSACSTTNPHSRDVHLEVQHVALEKHYEEAANELQLKVEEHKKLLRQLELKSYLYGKHADEMKAHCQELIALYEKAVDANRKMAQMASETSP